MAIEPLERYVKPNCKKALQLLNSRSRVYTCAMTNHTEGLQHHHLRKKIQQEQELDPHPVKWKRFIDRAIYVVGLIGPIMTIPQLTKIWIEKNASGVSAISWAAYTVVAIFWIIYGVAHKEKPLIIISAVWVVLEVLIVIGTLMYG